ncbi:hypothetical protein HY967_02180 [Candidatus Jorgensenbacteria bacterium]|nr:hypothetical protein [Candidatus Jorgensenbacteria bacterium]
MKFEWQIDISKYLERLEINQEELSLRLRLPEVKAVNQVIPLRDIIDIDSIMPLHKNWIHHIVRHITTLDGQHPFTKAKFQMVKVDPRHLKIGQRFVYRENYQALLEMVPNVFHEFLVTNGGLSDLGAYFVFGRDENDIYSLATYLPPLIELHGSNLVIMDGIHRNYIAKQMGTTLNAILLTEIDIPFPCGPRDWSEIEIISLEDKPKDINNRYFDLNKDLFRDLKYLGIDG